MRPVTDIFNANTRPFLAAEVGLAHEGSLGLAHKFIDAVATTGADAVKFQTHIAEAESSPEEKFRVSFSYEDATRFDYWKRTAFTVEQWAGLKKHAEEKGLVFLSSPFSLEAVELLETIGIAAWKIASGELGSRRMLEQIAATGKPIIASTGMSSWDEVNELHTTLARIAPARHTILQCTTEYPTPSTHVGMNIFDDYRSRLQCPVGISDHSGTIWPAIIAASRGARFIEVHVTLSPHMFGPDIASSLTVEKLTELSQGLDFVHGMLQNPIDKDALATQKAPLKKLFGKSALALEPLRAGEIVHDRVIAFRKPGIGLSEAEFDALTGRKLTKNISSGTFLKTEDFK
jgi:N,N'-diacetyllegionaminate synthase